MRHGTGPEPDRGGFGQSRAPLLVVLGLVLSACTASTPISPTPLPSASPVPLPEPATYSLGHFPAVPTGSLPGATVAALQAILDAAAKGLPGVTATVMVASEGTWSGAAGTADGVQPMEAGSQFSIASNTKTVIAAEVIHLSEQGLLRLSDPVTEHLPPNFHFDASGVTIENLLSMESGIPDPALDQTAYSLFSADPLKNWTAEEVLASVPANRAKPGDHFVYEDSNYMLLGLVVQQTTGMSVARALRSYILADPRLASLVYQTEEQPRGPLALPFLGGQVRPNIVQVGGGYLPTKAEASFPSGSAGMASDSGALALWGYLLFGGELLSEASLAAMTDFAVNDASDRYGLGVFDQTTLGSGFWTQSVGNGGWDDGGYSSVLAVLPSGGIAISVMTNTAGDPVSLVIPVAQKLAEVLQP